MRTITIGRTVIGILILSLSGYCGTSFAQEKIAPDFSLPDLQGKMISSKSLRGKFVVIHFATTWCPFCNAEAPHLEALHQEYKQRGVEVLIIDVQEPGELVAKKLRDRFNLSFPVLIDIDGAVAASFAPSDVLPDLSRAEVMLASNLIIDPEGKIRFMSLLDSQHFDAKLVSLKEHLNGLLGMGGKKAGHGKIIRINDHPANPIQAGKQSTVEVAFKIEEGFHVQADKVNNSNLIALKLIFTPPDGIAIGQPEFPPYNLFQLEGANEPFWVFDKDLNVGIPVSVAENKQAGIYLLRGKLHYQACDSRKCYFPEEYEFAVALKVN
jgi:peroxiredoxin